MIFEHLGLPALQLGNQTFLRGSLACELIAPKTNMEDFMAGESHLQRFCMCSAFACFPLLPASSPTWKHFFLSQPDTFVTRGLKEKTSRDTASKGEWKFSGTSSLLLNKWKHINYWEVMLNICLFLSLYTRERCDDMAQALLGGFFLFFLGHTWWKSLNRQPQEYLCIISWEQIAIELSSPTALPKVFPHILTPLLQTSSRNCLCTCWHQLITNVQLKFQETGFLFRAIKVITPSHLSFYLGKCCNLVYFKHLVCIYLPIIAD